VLHELHHDRKHDFFYYKKKQKHHDMNRIEKQWLSEHLCQVQTSSLRNQYIFGEVIPFFTIILESHVLLAKGGSSLFLTTDLKTPLVAP